MTDEKLRETFLLRVANHMDRLGPRIENQDTMGPRERRNSRFQQLENVLDSVRPRLNEQSADANGVNILPQAVVDPPSPEQKTTKTRRMSIPKIGKSRSKAMLQDAVPEVQKSTENHGGVSTRAIHTGNNGHTPMKEVSEGYVSS
jgi:hypothetical protein